jgi:hypothetical protein
MPYHNLGEAHRRLFKKLPDNSVYRLTLRKGLWDALVRLWKETGEAKALRATQDK